MSRDEQETGSRTEPRGTPGGRHSTTYKLVAWRPAPPLFGSDIAHQPCSTRTRGDGARPKPHPVIPSRRRREPPEGKEIQRKMELRSSAVWSTRERRSRDLILALAPPPLRCSA